MVGRGWWVLVWTVCAGWMVCVVCAGLTCQPGQEFFSGQQGQCVPCTRCHDPQVVVVPCYVYQDAVCAPAAQFIPNWPQSGQPQLPITLSTSPAPHTKATRVHGRHRAGTPGLAEGEEPKKSKGTSHGKPHGSRSGTRQHSNATEGGNTLPAQDDPEKSSGEHRQHNHRHKHQQDHRSQTHPGKAEEAEASSGGVSEDRGAEGEEASEGSTDAEGRNTSGGMESASRGLSDGANNNNTSDRVEESDSEQPDAVAWKETFLFAAIIVVSVCIVVLTVVTLSHLRNILARRKLKRVYDGIPSEGSGEARVMEQLLPSSLDGAPVVASRGTVTYIRATTATSSTPSSPSITTTASMSVEAQRTSGHVMDRLLEQRRVLGPASSVDTNLYIESWQQQDSHPAGHAGLAMQGHCSPPRGTVSACPSPIPVRTYRPGPASASASPTVSVRGLNVTRGHVRGGVATPVCALTGSGHGGGS